VIGTAKIRLDRSARLLLAFVSLVLAAVPALAGQQSGTVPKAGDATSPLPAFEVASIRPPDPNRGEVNGFYTYPGGRIVARGCTFQYLVMLAFDVQEFQISGGPGWMKDDRYDIQAKPPESSPVSKSNPATAKSPPSQEQRLMLQSLLIDRFQLRFHHTTKEGSVYLLTRGTKELKLQAPKDKNAFPWAGGIDGGWFGGGIRGENISMPQLAARLSRFFERPVLDQTGMQGSFDFEYGTGDENNDADIPAFLIGAMKEIGLKLAPGKGSIDAIVIDHAEKPSEN
jgi:uncharacterized protein (TIGR03435 family)